MGELAQNYPGDDLRTGRLRRRLWFERGFFTLLALGGLVYYGLTFGFSRGACVIEVGGRPVAVVESRAAASHVLEEIKRGAAAAPNADFAEQVTLHDVSGKGARALPEADALKLLSSRLTLAIPGAAVFLDGKLLFGFPDQGQAVHALALLLQEFSPPGPDWTRTLSGKVRIVNGPVPVDKFLPSAQAAVAMIRRALDEKKLHVVRAGDSLWKISQDYGSTIDRVRRANPDVDFRFIQAGQTIAVPVGQAPITVEARKEFLEPAANGAGTQTILLRYINGVETERQVIRRPFHADHSSDSPPTGGGPRRHRARVARPAAHRATSRPAPPVAPRRPVAEEPAAPPSNPEPVPQETPSEP